MTSPPLDSLARFAGGSGSFEGLELDDSRMASAIAFLAASESFAVGGAVGDDLGGEEVVREDDLRAC